MGQVAALVAISSLKYLGKILMVLGLLVCLLNVPTVFVNMSSIIPGIGGTVPGTGGSPIVVVDVDKDGKISPTEAVLANINNYASQQGNPINKASDAWNQFTSLLGSGMSNWDYLALQAVQAEILKDGIASIDEIVVGGGLAYIGLSSDSLNILDRASKTMLANDIGMYCIYRNLGFSEQAALTAASLVHLDKQQFMWGWGSSWQDIATATAVAAAVDGNTELATVAAAVAWYLAGGIDGNPWTPW